MKKTIKNQKEMEKFAQSFANKIQKKGQLKGQAVVIGLYGDLGSGKTTFTKSFIEAFGVKQTVTSPTFVIEKIYKLPKENNLILTNKKWVPSTHQNKFKHIIHIDAYRLNNVNEMIDLGWDHILTDEKNIILIEWPENIEKILPKKIQKIQFKFIDENKREIIF